jgi:hypothetical protein
VNRRKAPAPVSGDRARVQKSSRIQAKDSAEPKRISFRRTLLDMKRILLLMALAGVFGFSTIADSSTEKPAPPRVELKRFDLDFPGGTPKELVAQLNKPLDGTLNVIIPFETDDVVLPPMKLRNVNAAEVFQALGRASQKTIRFKVGRDYQTATEMYQFTTEGMPTESSVWAFRASRPVIPQLPQDKTYRFYQLGPYLEDLKIEDITTAIQTAEKMINMGNPPELKFHSETKLLIAVGDEEGFDLIDDVLKALPKSGAKPVRAAEVLVNGYVNKPGNVLLPKDQKSTILDAIGQAGGLDVHSGGPKTIRFSRPGESERVFKFDELKREHDPAKIIYLEPGDVIDVGL